MDVDPVLNKSLAPVLSKAQETVGKGCRKYVSWKTGREARKRHSLDSELLQSLPQINDTYLYWAKTSPINNSQGRAQGPTLYL